MNKLDKIFILLLAIFTIFVQIVFLLPSGGNASVTYPVIISVQDIAIDTSGTVINGTKNVSMSSDYSIPDATFYIYDTATYATNYVPSALNMTLTAGSEGRAWTGTLNTANLPSGNYKLFSKGWHNSTEYTSNYVYFTVGGATEIPNLASWVQDIPDGSTSYTAISGTKNIGMNSNVSVPSATFFIYGTSDAATNLYSTAANITLVAGSEGKTWTGAIDTTKLANGTYHFYAKSWYNSTEYSSNYVYFSVNNIVVTETAAAPVIIPWIQDVISPSTVISGTKNAGANSDQVLSSVTYYVYNIADATVNYAATALSLTASDSYKTWSGTIDTTKLANGNYKFFIKGYANGTEYTGDNIYFSAENVATETEAVNITLNAKVESVTASGATISGTKELSVFSNPSGYVFTGVSGKIKKNGTVVLDNLGLTQSATGWNASFNSTALSNGDGYSFCAWGYYSGVLYDTCSFMFNVNNTTPVPAPANPTFTITSQMSGVTQGSTISGTKSATASVTSSPTGYVLDHLKFVLRSTANESYYPFAATSPSANNWQASIDTATLSNGNHDFYAESYYSDTIYKSDVVNINVNNATPAPTDNIIISFIDIPAMPLKGDNKIFIKTSAAPDSVTFKVAREGGSSEAPAAAKIDATNFYFLWNTTKYIDGNYTIYATAKKGYYESTNSITASVANYSDVTPTPTETESLALYFNDSFRYRLSGDKKLFVSANLILNSCKYKVEGTKFAEFTGTVSGTGCTYLLHTLDFPDGKYTVRAIATSGKNSKEAIAYMTIANQTNISPTEETNPDFYLPAECKEKGYLTSDACQKYMETPYDCRIQNVLDQTACQNYLYQSSMPEDCVKQGTATKEECDKIMSAQYMLTDECKSANITDSDACNKYMIEKFAPSECQNATSQEECNYTMMNSITSLNSMIPATSDAMTSLAGPTAESFPEECQKAQITSPEECKSYMTKLLMPAECQEAKAATEEECEKVMFKKYAPKECVDAQIFDAVECEKFMFKKYAPDDCKQAGIFNPEACKKYMFEKYDGKENIPEDKFPIECQKANATTAADCETVMKNLYMPQECKDQGIDDQDACDQYFKKKYMPDECQKAGASSRKECDKIMFDKYAPKECQKAGIADGQECEKYMFNLYAPKVKCQSVDDWQCKNSLEKNHLGNVVAKQAQFNQIKENSNKMIGKSMKVEALIDSNAFENKEMIPLVKKDVNLKVIPTKENLVLDEEDTLTQTGPIAFMIDADGDGLPDDIEKRLKTDPQKTDTDGDGFSDSDELKNGYDPNGPGKLAEALSPVDEAILNNKTLEHPKTEGETSGQLKVSRITNSYKTGDEEKGYALNGKAEPNSVATLYIYSDLPLVVTVKTDEFGNWKYQLDESLTDGDHEAYVVVNDNTGKVVQKSQPLNFWIESAKAMSVNDFISTVKARAESEQAKQEAEISVNTYNNIAIIIVILGIISFVALLKKAKKIKNS